VQSAQLLELREDQPDHLAGLRVRVQHDAAARPADIPRRRINPKLPASCFGQPVAPHPRLDQIQFGLLCRGPNFEINQAWCLAAAIAADLIAWLQILALHGELARAEPKRLRYRLLHTAARLVHGQRRRWLRIPASWPWAEQITAAFTRIAAIPAPG
jgi:hypothetical protein